jgi:RimJ/RimL family protein N-acetyltransferase
MDQDALVIAYLTTERLTLRRFTAADADLLIELDSDPAVMRYLTGGEPTAPEDVRERDLPSILAGYERWGGDFGVFAAQDQERGAFVGWFLLRPKRGGPLDEVELGYRLRRAEWGKGYATEGSRALLSRAFTELGVRMVWAETMFLNNGSRKVMGKVGMTMTDTLDTPPDMQMVEGAEHGGVRYEITKERWEQGSAGGFRRHRASSATDPRTGP